MSHFLFVGFITKQIIRSVKKTYTNKDIFYLFNQKIHFCNDVMKVIQEHKKSRSENWCLITSKLQKTNSQDILLPYDKYSQQDLFPNGADRMVFENTCFDNLNAFHANFLEFMEDIKPFSLRIFVVEGYDNDFTEKNCTLDTMIQDLESQATKTFFFESTIYNIQLDDIDMKKGI